MLFRGRHRRRPIQLTHCKAAWPVQDTYAYLGCTQGIMHGLAGLQQAGRRAAMDTLARCRQLHISDVGTVMSMFNNQVLPCLLFRAEVWLPYLSPDRASARMLPDPVQGLRERLERVQPMFIKCLLHLCHSAASTPSWVVLAETSRQPGYLYTVKRVQVLESTV